jgi:hypothetical protein
LIAGPRKATDERRAARADKDAAEKIEPIGPISNYLQASGVGRRGGFRQVAPSAISINVEADNFTRLIKEKDQFIVAFREAAKQRIHFMVIQFLLKSRWCSLDSYHPNRQRLLDEANIPLLQLDLVRHVTPDLLKSATPRRYSRSGSAKCIDHDQRQCFPRWFGEQADNERHQSVGVYRL